MLPVDLEDAELSTITEIMRSEAGISLGESKRALVAARLSARLRELNCGTFADYCEHLATRDPDGQELRRMINRLTTNKTSFFREPHHFDFVQQRLIPRLLAREQRKLRIWSAGCSTGQEPYSIAMLLASDPRLADWDIRILASDIDTDVLQQAETGEYSPAQTGSIPPPLRAGHFERLGTTLRMGQRVRDLITFRRINLIEEPWPIQTSFDIIFCRNVTIYFDPPTRTQLYQRFAAQLAPDGHLFIGHSEHIQAMKETFTLVGSTIYCLTASCDRAGRPPGGSWRPLLRSRPPLRTIPSLGPLPMFGAGLLPHAGASASPEGAPALALEPPAPASASTPESSAAPPSQCREVRLDGTGMFASPSPTVAEAVLGASVAVCVFDPEANAGGVWQFSLRDDQPDEPSVPCPGIRPLEELLAALETHGARRPRLKAKIFGGGCAFDELDGPGSERAAPEHSVDFARRQLDERAIPIVAERVGGDRPVLLRFETHTGRAFVRVLEAERERR